MLSGMRMTIPFSFDTIWQSLFYVSFLLILLTDLMSLLNFEVHASPLLGEKHLCSTYPLSGGPSGVDKKLNRLD